MKTLTIKRSQLTYPGSYRDLRVDTYSSQSSIKRAVVMTTAFIENGYWYQIEKKGYSLAKRIAQEGFDVYVLSFVLKEKWPAHKIPQDASFSEMVCEHLPNLHRQLAAQYQDIHYIGHSFGVTVLLAYLMGYRKNPKGEWMPDAKDAEQNANKVRSFVSLAGLFQLQWPKRSLFPDPTAFKTWIYPLLSYTAAQLPSLAKIPWEQRLPTSKLSATRHWPVSAVTLGMLKCLEAIGLMPSFHFANADMEALRLAMSEGSSDESMELFRTVLGLHPNARPLVSNTAKRGRAPSNKKAAHAALHNFCEDLRHIHTPILFIQGELDQITHPQTIQRYGFDRVQSVDKTFTILKNTGHQDMLAAKNPEKLFVELKNWLNREFS